LRYIPKEKHKPFIPPLPKLPGGFCLIIDTREQNPLFLPKPPKKLIVVRETLEVGDYSIKQFEHNICIERKNLADLFISLGKDRKRFKAELDKIKGNYEWFGLLIEATEDEVLTPQQFSQMNINSVYNSLISIQMKYNCHIYFSKNRYMSELWVLNSFVKWFKYKRGLN